MTAGGLLEVSLELRSDGERIAGRLRDREGRDWPFSGWLGLLTLLERLRTGVPGRDYKSDEER